MSGDHSRTAPDSTYITGLPLRVDLVVVVVGEGGQQEGEEPGTWRKEEEEMKTSLMVTSRDECSGREASYDQVGEGEHHDAGASSRERSREVTSSR